MRQKQTAHQQNEAWCGFSSIADFDWTTAFVMEDQRCDYEEFLDA